MPFFFCQLEAIETLIWLTEAPAAEKTGIDIEGDGGGFSRYCCKMATGTGKTVVMAMLIAWQVLNKTAYPADPRYSRNVLVIAPGLTVNSRLSVLVPSSEGNYYDAFAIVPPGLAESLRQGKVLVQNWHALAWESAEQIQKRKSVDKRGPKSDEAYVREVLGDMARHNNLIVINDEAHHAWRVPAESKVKGVAKTRSIRPPSGFRASTASTRQGTSSPASTSPPRPSPRVERGATKKPSSPGSSATSP